jgi:putative amide transporter protein
MTLALLILINMMWIPAGFFLFGKGEPKSTGALTGMVGILVVIGALLQAAVFKDPFMGGFLFTFGLLFLTLSYALLKGLTDFSTVGNAALVVAIASVIYCVLFITGGSGGTTIAKNAYFAFCTITWAVLTLCIFGFTRGKISGKIVGTELVVLSFVTLFLPAVGLMGYGKLPF